MLEALLSDAEVLWREIARLATPLDSDKPVDLTPDPNSKQAIEAYTDNKTIFIKLNNEKKLRADFDSIVIPAYRLASARLYDVALNASDPELLKNIALDTFLFIHFHEQMHPWLCPNSKVDQASISKALYEGIAAAEPALGKTEVLSKVDACKNLVWDTVLNVSFVQKTTPGTDMSRKISYVFTKDGRSLEYQPIAHFPSGILPVLYMISAVNKNTDIPISLMGLLYASVSYNDPALRQKAMDVFQQDLKSKRLANPADVLKQMYAGLVSELKPGALKDIGIDKQDYTRRIGTVANPQAADYEANQEYFVNAISAVFDSPLLRYDSLKGFIKVISPYIKAGQKQGSPDPNTKGTGSGSGDGSGGDATGAGSAQGSGIGGAPSQDEMDADSMSDTLDDLLGSLGKKEADELMGAAANSSRGYGPANPSQARLILQACDEFYKRNADVIDVRNPKSETMSIDVGKRKKWKLVRTSTLNAEQAAKLNYRPIMNFEATTGLPVLLPLGAGFYQLNEYTVVETPLKSTTTVASGIEIPDNWIIFQDTSGSMGGTNYVNTGQPLDILQRVKYGIMKGLYKVCKDMGKDMKMGVVNFSDATFYKGIDSLVRLYDAKSSPIKDLSLSTQCGGTECEASVFGKIAKDIGKGKTVITFITDGEITGATDALYRAIAKFSSEPNHAFVYFNIGMPGSFDSRITRLATSSPFVQYFAVQSAASIKDTLKTVLIRYT